MNDSESEKETVNSFTISLLSECVYERSPVSGCFCFIYMNKKRNKNPMCCTFSLCAPWLKCYVHSHTHTQCQAKHCLRTTFFFCILSYIVCNTYYYYMWLAYLIVRLLETHMVLVFRFLLHTQRLKCTEPPKLH